MARFSLLYLSVVWFIRRRDIGCNDPGNSPNRGVTQASYTLVDSCRCVGEESQVNLGQIPPLRLKGTA